MKIARTRQSLRDAIRELRAQGKTIGLVPTMGALHKGHISLIRTAQQHADAVVATIFVNPAQFGPNEDFSKYPRTEEEDIGQLQQAGAALAYLPSAEEIYAPGFSTILSAGKIATELCGAFRPGHFDGVATVVTKLLLQALPDMAVFGEKDYQQLHIIRQVVRDLDIPVQIEGAPIIREPDGLAMSSRNRYLDANQRAIAAKLYETLQSAGHQIKEGNPMDDITSVAKAELRKAGFHKIDYMELRDAESLSPVKDARQPARLLAAAHLGTTRLIDNIAV